jgi:excinuclease UvrABC ATPase subunit
MQDPEEEKVIEVLGAHVFNLKNIDVKIPHGRGGCHIILCYATCP